MNRKGKGWREGRNKREWGKNRRDEERKKRMK